MLRRIEASRSDPMRVAVGFSPRWAAEVVRRGAPHASGDLANVAPRRPRLAGDKPGLESPGYQHWSLCDRRAFFIACIGRLSSRDRMRACETSRVHCAASGGKRAVASMGGHPPRHRRRDALQHAHCWPWREAPRRRRGIMVVGRRASRCRFHGRSLAAARLLFHETLDVFRQQVELKVHRVPRFQLAQVCR